MKKIAFLTCERFQRLTSSDQLVADYLERKEISCEPVVWNDPAINWDQFDLLLVRSVWDYHLLFEEWVAFLQKLMEHKRKVLNPIDVLLWNSDKRYLQEILGDQKQVPFQIFEQGSEIDLKALMSTASWEKLVVKPTVSASGFKTWSCHISEATAKQEEFELLLKERDLIVQEFAPEVVEQGEWSLVFFDKVFSHAVLKRVKVGEFRVQSDYGGTSEKGEAPSSAIQTAQDILDGIPSPICYARVDGIMRDGAFYLMELELIEPELFVDQVRGSEKAFGAAILKAL
ncbi:MAG: hypothetical protein AAF696_29520 [Bacteroidota bacterium]